MNQPNDLGKTGRSLHEDPDIGLYDRGYRAGVMNTQLRQDDLIAALDWCTQHNARVSWWGTVVIEWSTSQDDWIEPPDHQVEAKTFLEAVAKAKALLEEIDREKETAY